MEQLQQVLRRACSEDQLSNLQHSSTGSKRGRAAENDTNEWTRIQEATRECLDIARMESASCPCDPGASRRGWQDVIGGRDDDIFADTFLCTIEREKQVAAP
jgi:hypothetical protein